MNNSTSTIETVLAMNKQVVSKLQTFLEEERKALLTKLTEASKASIDVDGDEIDAIQARILAHAASQIALRDKSRLFKIQTALKKIQEGTFGSCEECGEGISEKRLRINPEFNTCIDCAEYLEKIAKRIAKGL